LCSDQRKRTECNDFSDFAARSNNYWQYRNRVRCSKIYPLVKYHEIRCISPTEEMFYAINVDKNISRSTE
ncbi:hypothetical protein T06_682, partial [Trichinella sp. T6]